MKQQLDPSVVKYVSTDTFQKFTDFLEENGPSKMVLPWNSTSEHRAHHQIRTEEYARIIAYFRKLHNTDKINPITETYETP